MLYFAGMYSMTPRLACPDVTGSVNDSQWPFAAAAAVV